MMTDDDAGGGGKNGDFWMTSFVNDPSSISLFLPLGWGGVENPNLKFSWGLAQGCRNNFLHGGGGSQNDKKL